MELTLSGGCQVKNRLDSSAPLVRIPCGAPNEFMNRGTRTRWTCEWSGRFEERIRAWCGGAWGLKGVMIGLLVLGLAGCGGSNGPGGMGQMPVFPVAVMEVRAEDIAYHGKYPGRIRGARQVDVRARVGGILEERLYEEGQVVGQGEVLFRIDPRPYEIALLQAEAELANGRAALEQAKREWRRVSGLFEQKGVSERERDRSLSELELATARVQLLEARVAGARLNLEYTLVAAPIAGVTRLEALSEGNLVDVGTLLTSIVELDPVHVHFALPDRDVLVLRAPRASGNARDEDARREARLLLADGRQHEEAGDLNFMDSTIDPRTGTVSVRAVFANPEGRLVPGQFVRVRVLLREYKDVILIPPEAVGEGREGPQVFVVRDDDTVEDRQVSLGPVTGGRQIILDGLRTGERIVVNGQAPLREGMPVSVQPEGGTGE